jgi:hypothetical protein
MRAEIHALNNPNYNLGGWDHSLQVRHADMLLKPSHNYLFCITATAQS